MVSSKKSPQPRTPEQIERAFRIFQRMFAGPYAEAILTDPKAMRHAAERAFDAVALFEEVAK